MNFNDRLQQRVKEVEKSVYSFLPEIEGPQATVIDAMHYSVKAGGKRLRPMMMEESFRLFQGQGEEVKPFMAALEFIHNYSLVHDDLPAMDNDEYRRGMKTTHVMYGEDLAILAGDALLNYAFETATKGALQSGEKGVKALEILARKAGIFGMVGGQCVDVMNENNKKELTLSELTFIHENKTAALIEAALMCGAVLAGANEQQVNTMERIGSNVGVAFQIQDDILDVTSTFEELGKPIGSDEKNHKETYVSLLGIEDAKREVETLSKEAVSLLKGMEAAMGNSNPFLEELLLSLIHRSK